MNKMGYGDVCNTSLDLGLGFEWKHDEDRLNYNRQRQKSRFKFDNLFHPSSLTLSLISSDENHQEAGKTTMTKDSNEDQSNSPNNTISSFSNGSGVKKEKAGFGNQHEEVVELERVSSRVSDEDEESNARKKLRLDKEQSALLEQSFKEHNTLNSKQKQALAKQLNLSPRQVEVWFQNRRARTKLKQTEVDCEILKKCSENLTYENRRLQKELQELKALKFEGSFSSTFDKGTTLRMCPSCERIIGSDGVGESSSSSSSSKRKSSFIMMSTKSHFFNPFSTSSAH